MSSTLELTLDDARQAALAATAPPATPASAWTPVCRTEAILPDTGVCALVEGRHVAVFRVGADRFFAIDNVDPRNGASVLSRGLVGNLGERLVVASPLYKHHIALDTGECLEEPAWSVQAHALKVQDGVVWVSLA